MRIIIAPDKFKGCLDATAVAAAISAGVRRACRNAAVDICPMADGGEGTVTALARATGGKVVQRTVTGPLPGTRVRATLAMLGDGQTAAIEMSAASGLHLLQPADRNPMNTTTYGTGELLMAALSSGVRRIVLGIGGSATTDGGVGAAQACGAIFATQDGQRRGPGDAPLCGRDVRRIASVDVAGLRCFHDIDIAVACDVDNPLAGPRGAAAVYGPQKGATPAQVQGLDAALRQLSHRIGHRAAAHRPGAGAAGGLGFGMVSFFGAQLRSGIEIVIEATKLRRRLRSADLCITAEGRLDAQSLWGKTPFGVARACQDMGVPCVALAGSVDVNPRKAAQAGITAAFAICDGPMTLEVSMQQAKGLLTGAAERMIRLFARGGIV